MPRSDWLRYLTALTLQLFILWIIGQLIVGVWSQYEANRDAYRAYQQKSEQEQNKSAEEIAENCAIIAQVNPALRNCLAQKIHAYQKKDTTDKDLQAQQDMAFWAFIAAIVSGGGLIISIGGLYLLFESLRQTWKVIANDREIGEAQVRAYLAVESPEQHSPDMQPGKLFSEELRIYNTGQSPAFNVRYIAALMPLIYPLSNDQGDLLVPDKNVNVIEQGATIGAGRDIRIEAELIEPLDAQKIISVKNEGTTRLFAVVIVTYFDVFKKEERSTKYCAYLTKGVSFIDPITKMTGTRHEWALANVHNDAT